MDSAGLVGYRKTPRVRGQETKILQVKRERKKAQSMEQRTDDRCIVGRATQSYPSSLSPSMSQCLPLVAYFQDSSRGHSQSLSQITHITTRTCLDSGLSGVVDSVVDTLGAPE